MRALRHRNFQLYAAGQLVSLTGSWVHNTALSWLIYRLTHSEWMLGLTSLFTNLPMLVLGMVGGLAADRYTRKHIVILTQSVFLSQAAVLAFLTLNGTVQVWHVYGLGLAFGLANAFDIPARQAMLLDMTSREDLISAVSLNSMTFNLARILGPSLGGIAVAALGEGWCFALNAVSFFAVLLVLVLMRMPAQHKHDGAAGTLREGIRYVAENATAWRLLGICGLSNVCFSGVFVLGPFFAQDIFNTGAWGLGLLTAAMGAGAVAGTYFLAKSRDVSGLPRVTALNGLILGAALALYGVSPNFWLSIALMAVAGGSLMRLNAATNSTLQTGTPENLRGRIVSMFGMAVVGMSPIGAALFGALARGTGVRIAAVTAGVVCIASAFSLGRSLRAVGLVMLVLPAFPADSALLGKVDLYLKEASAMTGFAIKRPVPAAMMSAQDLEKYLKGKMKEEVNPNKVDIEEVVLKLFGFAPPDFKLKQTTLDLLQEQAAAFYDFKTKKLYVLDHVQEGLGPELLIHELGHALADQNFGLKKFLNGAKGDDDAALARMAVMEGQAMWLMGEHAAQQAGSSLKNSPEMVRRMSEPEDANDEKFPVMKRVPLYLKESLLFPYSWGFRFQAAVCAREADCMRRVFEKPPASSAQVMHPDLYFAGVMPEKVVPPEAPKGWKEKVEGSLGEVDFSVLLRTFGLESKGIAENNRGGMYRLYENKKTHDYLLNHASIWKDEVSAQRWFDAYALLLASKWTTFSVSRRNSLELDGTGERGTVRLRRIGRTVTAEEGLPVH